MCFLLYRLFSNRRNNLIKVQHTVTATPRSIDIVAQVVDVLITRRRITLQSLDFHPFRMHAHLFNRLCGIVLALVAQICSDRAVQHTSSIVLGTTVALGEIFEA